MSVRRSGAKKFMQRCHLVGGWATHLKDISQIGSFPQVGVKVKHIRNHHLVAYGGKHVYELSGGHSWQTFSIRVEQVS